jgi:uncharacterized protein involved in exopolysaccharide biosynthesis/Mrp family chromosome partitioning ATPase
LPNPKASQFGEAGDDIDLADIARFLRRQLPKIAYISAATTILALLSVLLATPYFSVNGSLYFGDAQIRNADGSSGQDLISNFQTVNDVPTEVALIQSRALVEQAILETGLNATAEPVGAGTMNYWKWRFGDHRAIQAYAPAPNDLTVLYATLIDPGDNGAAYQLKFGADGNYQLYDSDGDGPVLLSGRLDQPAAGNGVTFMVKLALAGPPPAPGSEYDLTITPAKSLAEEIIGGNLSVTQGGLGSSTTQTADISFQWSNPYQGEIFLNQLMKDFIATQLSWKTESASDTQKFISQQLENIKASLTDADSKLASYQAQTGIVDVPTNAQAVVNQLSQYEVQRTTAKLQEQALQELVDSTTDSEPGLNPYLVTQANDPVLAQLAGNLAAAEILLKTQSLQFTASSPELQTQQQTVLRTQEAIRTLLQNDKKLAEGNVANLDNLIVSYEDQLKSMPAQSLKITQLTRASTVYGQLYVLLMQDEETADVSKAATIVNTRIVSPAEVPLSATSPKTTITVLSGLVFGLLIGTMIVLAQRVLSGRFHSEGDIERSYNLPIFGLIPNRSGAELAAGVFSQRQSSFFSEAFRLLRSRIYLLFPDTASEARIILITSAMQRDGKTTLAVNLAKSIGDDGKRVLLIDGDLYRGRLHEVLSLPQAPGFAERLAGRAGSPAQPVPGQNFWAMTAGSYEANPASLLKDSTLELNFKLLKNEFDYIIIDCPPLPSVVDTLTFAKFANLVLSVVFLERTSRASFKAHNETLDSLAVSRGIIVNGLTGGPHYRGQSYDNVDVKISRWRRLLRRRVG